MFRFRLASLLTYREHQRDHCRQLLGQVIAEELRLQSEIDEKLVEHDLTLDEIRSLDRGTGFSPERVASRRFYTSVLKSQRLGLEAELGLVQQQKELCRQALVKADQGVKSLEKLRDSKQAEHDFEFEKHEARSREEIWQAGQYQRGVTW